MADALQLFLQLAQIKADHIRPYHGPLMEFPALLEKLTGPVLPVSVRLTQRIGVGWAFGPTCLVDDALDDRCNLVEILLRQVPRC